MNFSELDAVSPPFARCRKQTQTEAEHAGTILVVDHMADRLSFHWRFADAKA